MPPDKPSKMPPLVLVALDIADDTPLDDPGIAGLPLGWDAIPGSSAAQAFGGAWLARGFELAMKVPSAIVHEEANVILNPHHPGYAQLELTIVRPFTFDERMFK